ncbi:hypothetical protein [Sphingobium bisphenolivorans]|uniref:hypothetical protein n=1 Tax=Sphingobium bisphenolivorans TaxID=1335760 RepID=UPI00187BDD60|nr:hypothetical protein [Sphingobium bisphenolivorans]
MTERCCPSAVLDALEDDEVPERLLDEEDAETWDDACAPDPEAVAVAPCPSSSTTDRST